MTTHTLQTYLWWLVGLLIIAALAYGLSIYGVPVQKATEQQYVPPPLPSDVGVLQHGFDYLVQYTDSGFHPTELTVQTGQTVRFTNITVGTIQVTTGSTASPAIEQGRYWEYTLSQPGTFTFSSGNSSIMVTVQ